MLYPVQAPIKRGDNGIKVLNASLILEKLCAGGGIQSMPPGERPSEKELALLCAALKTEMRSAIFGEAMTSLLLYFQIQNGLGDSLRGHLIDDRTAQLLNEQAGRWPEFVNSAIPDNRKQVEVFRLCMGAATKSFALHFRLAGESQERMLRLTAPAATALLLMKSSSTYLVFDVTAEEFVATDTLL